jgi:N-acetylglucosamine-6-phosphate deacetylase
MATRTPADVLGLTAKGRLAPGADADLVLLNESFDVLWTLVGGELVHRSK